MMYDTKHTISILETLGYLKEELINKLNTNLMPDDKHKKALDSKFISLKEEWEREYWTNRLMASVETIQEAIDNTGSHSVKDIRAYLIRTDQ